jgi:hypothetical protein
MSQESFEIQTTASEMGPETTQTDNTLTTPFYKNNKIFDDKINLAMKLYFESTPTREITRMTGIAVTTLNR